jgi:hypothetical protein
MIRYKMFISVFLLFSIFNFTFAQDDAEESQVESSHDLYLAFDQTSGNTNNLVSGAEYGFSLLGNLGSLTDTEFSLSLGGNYATLEEEPYALDGNVHTQLDLWANQKYSPFLFYDYSFDRSLGLINRTDLALGAKIRFGKIFSLSYAYMFEEEEYDSVATFSRHSFRPKLKLIHSDGAFFMDYRAFYKPRVDDFDDYLLENILVLSVSTFYEALSVDITLQHSFNSKYDGDNKVLKPIEEWDSEYDVDFDDFIIKETYYKDTDLSVSIGFSLSF